MFISAIVPSAVPLVGMIFLPGSPRWLARVGLRDRALENFRRLRRDTQAEAELKDVEQVPAQEQQGFGILLQRGFRVAVLAVVQQITGINTIIYYAPTILEMSGYPSAKAAIFATAIIGITNVLIRVVSILLVDRLGRRFLLLVGTAGMTVALTLVGTSFHRHSSHIAVFCEVIFYVVSFGIGLGPVVWLLISEIYPTKIRGKAMSIATLSVWGANWLVAGAFLSLIDTAGPASTFWILAGICVLAFFFCFLFVPETKARSFEDIERHWRQIDAP